MDDGDGARDLSVRFAALCRRPEQEVPVEEAALLVAARANPRVDPDEQLGRLDALAADCAVPTIRGLRDHLFGAHGFAGNRHDYYDPANSYLDVVLDRRVGIPISLSVLAMAVGARVGVGLDGVSMPGHFLTRERSHPDSFLDAFTGELLDTAGCIRAFRRVQAGPVRFDPSWLAPVGSFAVLGRMLANLKSIFLAREDRASLAWCLELRSMVPGIESERDEYAAVLAATGRFGEAALVHEALASEAERAGGDGDEHRRRAALLRARLN